MHPKARLVPKLGIDIGRVIVGAVDDHGVADTSFLSGSEDDALSTPPVAEAFDTIARLVTRFEGRVWLVSKCGPRIQALTRRWLVHQRFHEITGVPAEHVRFCRERPQKREHAEKLGLTHFIDDRLDVLGHLRGVVPSLYWFGIQKSDAPDWVIPVRDWRAVWRALSPAVGGGEDQVIGRDPIDEPHA